MKMEKYAGYQYIEGGVCAAQGFTANGLNCGLNPVSYTHLDVYKRQVMAVLNFQRADFWLLERAVPLPGTGYGREVSSLKAFPSAICQYDTVIADRFSLKGIIRLTISQPGSFQRPFDNYLVRSTGNSSMQQRILIGTGPVSYTHLDVYKRQGRPSAQHPFPADDCAADSD